MAGKICPEHGLSNRIETRICHHNSLGMDDLEEEIDFTLAAAVVHEVPDASALKLKIRKEVWNSGALPDHLKLSDLKKPHASYPNNPLLAGTFYLADYIQKAGSGTLEMLKQCRAQGLPEQEFFQVIMISVFSKHGIAIPNNIFTEATVQLLKQVGAKELV